MATAKTKFIAKKAGVDEKEIGYEAEEEKEKEFYKMPIKEAVEEHERLVKVLKSGSRAELLKEANIQEKELKSEILGGKEEKNE